MADRQYVPLGEESAPAGWTLPAGLEIVPKVAYASYNNTSGSVILPCLRIVSDSGHVAAECVATTEVPAGGSADVTWFRGVTGGSSSSTGGGLTFAKASPSAFATVPAISGGAPGVVAQSQTLDYNGASSVFSLQSGTFNGGTVTGIGVLADGHYLVKSQVIITGMNEPGLVEVAPLFLPVGGGGASGYAREGRFNTVPSGSIGQDGFYVEMLFSASAPFPCGPLVVSVSNSTSQSLLTFTDTMVIRLDTDGTFIV